MLHPKDGPWGFFPMKLGQSIMGKYEIVRKLGYGTNASIWLAKVRKYVPRLPVINTMLIKTTCRDNVYEYVALKVLSINATFLEFTHETHETEVGQSFLELPQVVKEDPGYAHCATTWLIGSADSKWGIHYVCLLQPCGTSLETLRAGLPRHRLPLSVVKRVIKQMLQALHFLHTRFHVVHTGRLSWL